MKIDKNIPIPEAKNDHRKSVNWALFEVNDSVLFENTTRKQIESKVISARQYLFRNKIEGTFTYRKEGTGFRIWRVEV